MPLRLHPSVKVSPLPASPHTHCQSCLRRSLSSSPVKRASGVPQTNLRRRMFQWLGSAGNNFRQPGPDYQTHYLPDYRQHQGYNVRLLRDRFGRSRGPDAPESDALDEAAAGPSHNNQEQRQVFPLNKEFFSESVLSEALRLEVWKRVQVDKQSVRQVSAELSIDMRRVGAVVRLVEVEKKMRAEGQQLALPYAEAIHRMVPVTQFDPNQQPTPHESINDLPHHPLTAPQLFYPTSESRAFNRTDAGRVFSGAPRLPDSEDIGQGGAPANEPWQDTHMEIIGKRGHEMPVLKPADARIPHSHLIKHEQDKADRQQTPDDVQKKYEERLKADQESRARMHAQRVGRGEAARTRVQKGRWEFIVTDVQAGEGVGIRYGVPSQDRKRGNVRIPTQVAA